MKLSQQSSKDFNHFVILGIVWLTLAVRLAYLTYINEPQPDGMLFAPLCGVDAHIYDQYGQNALDGSWPGTLPLFRTPLYTVYLGLTYALFGVNHYASLIVQALIQAVAAAALYSVGRFIFSRGAGMLAALGLALYSPLIFYTGCFAQISLVTPLLTLVLFFLVKFQQQGQDRYLIMAGLMAGLAALGRPTVLILILAVIGWLLLHRLDYREWIKQTAYFSGMILLTLIPVAFFNYRVSGDFILISTNGPEVLFISNNADTEGRDILAPGFVQPIHRRLEIVSAGIERNETAFIHEVVNYIRRQPLDWLALEANKLWLLFGKSDLNILTVAFKYPTTERQITIFKVMPIQWHGLIILAFLGMILIRRQHTSLLLLIFIFITLATIIFFVQLRFRLLLAPVVLLYAAAVLATAPAWFRSEKLKFYVILCTLLLCVLVAPDIWPFSLAIMIGVGLWQAIQKKPDVDPKTEFLAASLWPLVVTWCLFVLAIVTAQILTSVNRIGQSEDYYLGPEITGDIYLGQTFRPDCDGLNRIRLTVGVYNKTHDQPVTFHLHSQTTNREIFISQFTTENLSDRTFKEFVFFPQPDSGQQTYLAYLTSPTSHPGNSITLRGFSDLPVDLYPHGTAIVEQGGVARPFPGDLAFTAFCDADPIQTIDVAFARLPGPRWFYWVILVGHVFLLIVSLMKTVQKIKVRCGYFSKK